MIFQMSGPGRHCVFLIICLALAAMHAHMAKCQIADQDYSPPELTDKGRIIENTISLEISPSDFEVIKEISGKKRTVRARLLVINGDTLDAEKISTHGKTTLYYRRKSYNISLNPSATFYHGEKMMKLKKFYVLGLSMDRNYCNNRLAFEMMDKAGFFHLFYTFCELKINGQTQGICMVVERPEDWALKEEKSIFLIRRGFNNSIDKLKAGRKADRDDIREYRQNFMQIYHNLNKYEGEELFKVISESLDTEDYMRWMQERERIKEQEERQEQERIKKEDWFR